MSKLILVNPNIYSRTIETMKCSTTIKNVAWIRLVIDEMSYCLFYENSYRIAECFWLLYCIVSMNIVTKVVRLNMKLEKAPRIAVSFPKNVLKMLVPVDTIFVKSLFGYFPAYVCDVNP